MSRELKLTLLGTGSSGGVPRIGNDWGVCDPDEPRNRRMRCSALIEMFCEGAERPTRVLIDTSPDLREQMLMTRTDALDAVVFTHDHADQTHGIDDVRVFAIRSRRQLPAYMDAPTKASLATKFSYCFEGKGGYPAILALQPLIEPGRAFSIDGPGGPVELLPVEQEHGRIVSLGFRIGPIAYCNDVSDMSPEALARLEGVEVFVIDALRYTPHPTHAHLEKALDWSRRVGARDTILTNLHVDMDYRTLVNELPDGVRPAHDGLSVSRRIS
mgnify:CR=1 FL=1